MKATVTFFNADETSIFSRLIMDNTLTFKREKYVDKKLSKG
jgi:hypothetical protein